MAVKTQYVVIRTNKDGEELEVKTFTDKRSADDYDKMLDMADAVHALLEHTEVSLTDKDKEELSIFFAQNREELLIALQAKKKPVTKKKNNDKQQNLLNDEEVDISPASLSETLLTDNKSAKQEITENEAKLVDFVIEKDDAA